MARRTTPEAVPPRGGMGRKHLIAYDIKDLDPGLRNTGDDGDNRLRPLRPILRHCANAHGVSHFLEPGPGGLAGRLGPDPVGSTADEVEIAHESILQSLMTPSAPHSPRIRLLRQTLRTVTTEEADAWGADETLRLLRWSLIPLKRSTALAIPPRDPPLELGTTTIPSHVRVTFGRSILPTAASDAFLNVHWNPEAPHSIRFGCTSCDGQQSDFPSFHVPNSLLNQVRMLFNVAVVVAPSLPPAAEVVPLRLPSSPSDLTEELQARFAAFCQDRLRLHVALSAAAPGDAYRPMAVDSTKLIFRKSPPAGRGTLNVRLILHASSGICLCGAHHKPPIAQSYPAEQFTGKQQVVVDFEMCGRALEGRQASELLCSVHSRPGEVAPGICCAVPKISAKCLHWVHRQGEAQPQPRIGTLFTFLKLPSVYFKEAQLLMAEAAGFARSSIALHGEGALVNSASALQQLVERSDARIHQRMQQFEFDDLERFADKESAERLVELDLEALKCLQSGGWARAPERKNTQLTLHSADGARAPQPKLRWVRHYYNLFPESLSAARKRDQGSSEDAPALRHVGSTSSLSMRSESPTLSVRSARSLDEPRPKVQCIDDRYDYQTLVEYADVDGIEECMKQLRALQATTLTDKEFRRSEFYLQYLAAIVDQYGLPVPGPKDIPAQYLRCKYRMRNGGGRLYPHGMGSLQDRGEARSVCIQSAPRELRPFLCCRWGFDIDMISAHASFFLQLRGKLQWAHDQEARRAAAMPQLTAWVEHRKEFIAHLTEVHCLKTDGEMYDDYRKDKCKELFNSLMYGGTYEGWIKKLGRNPAPHCEPRSPRIVALIEEFQRLRADVFASHEWHPFVERERERLRREQQKTPEQIDRSVFSRIAQLLENQILDAMRNYLKLRNWNVLTLCFDGLIVQHDSDRNLDLRDLEASILQETGYAMGLAEKPLYSPTFPTLSLARANE
tara:strand:- start:4646 stop:7519 length:2874 start_codon:yes stop_codon:yes gene_type:complete